MLKIANLMKHDLIVIALLITYITSAQATPPKSVNTRFSARIDWGEMIHNMINESLVGIKHLFRTNNLPDQLQAFRQHFPNAVAAAKLPAVDLDSYVVTTTFMSNWYAARPIKAEDKTWLFREDYEYWYVEGFNGGGYWKMNADQIIGPINHANRKILVSEIEKSKLITVPGRNKPAFIYVAAVDCPICNRTGIELDKYGLGYYLAPSFSMQQNRPIVINIYCANNQLQTWREARDTGNLPNEVKPCDYPEFNDIPKIFNGAFRAPYFLFLDGSEIVLAGSETPEQLAQRVVEHAKKVRNNLSPEEASEPIRQEKNQAIK